MRPRRVALVLAVPVAAGLTIGSLVITHDDRSAELTAVRSRIGSTALANLPDVASAVSAGVGAGGDDAQADLAAVQDVAFSASTKAASARPVALVKQTPAKIRAAAASALAHAGSVHVTGALPCNGRNTGVDFQVAKAAAEGTLTYPDGTLTIRRIGTTLYYRPDDKLLTAVGASDEIVEKSKDQWAKVVPGNKDYEGFAAVTRLSTYVTITAHANASGRKPGPTLGGLPSVTVYGGRGPRAQSLYVATSGPAYPLYLASRDKSFHLAFSHFGQDVSVDEPDQDHSFAVTH